eukprot:m.246479 g.246479  ORF g.246479 m.246479 type:complete len:513 (+) comp19065_c0_seq15:3276-4814(+)
MAKVCFGCERPLPTAGQIHPGEAPPSSDEMVVEVALVGGHSYHPACIKCSVCHVDLGDEAHLSSTGHLLCAQHAQGASDTPCVTCNAPVSGPCVVFEGSQRYHPRCFACQFCSQHLETGDWDCAVVLGKPVCDVCANKLCLTCSKPVDSDDPVLFGKFPVHQACLRCSDCNAVVSVVDVQVVGESLYCPKHAPDDEDLAVKLVVCAGCLEPVSPGQGYLTALDCEWHNNCFCCAKCQHVLDEEFTVIDEDPFCLDCGKSYDVQGKEYHVECLACAICKKPFLEGQSLCVQERCCVHPACVACRGCEQRITNNPPYFRVPSGISKQSAARAVATLMGYCNACHLERNKGAPWPTIELGKVELQEPDAEWLAKHLEELQLHKEQWQEEHEKHLHLSQEVHGDAHVAPPDPALARRQRRQQRLREAEQRIEAKAAEAREQSRSRHKQRRLARTKATLEQLTPKPVPHKDVPKSDFAALEARHHARMDAVDARLKQAEAQALVDHRRAKEADNFEF